MKTLTYDEAYEIGQRLGLSSTKVQEVVSAVLEVQETKVQPNVWRAIDKYVEALGGDTSNVPAYGTARTDLLAAMLEVQPVQGLQSVADALTIEQLNEKVERLMAVQPSQAGELNDIELAHLADAHFYKGMQPTLVHYVAFAKQAIAASNAKRTV